MQSDGFCWQTRRGLPNTSLQALRPEMSAVLPGCFGRMQFSSQTIFLLWIGCRSHPPQYHMALTRECSLL
ncbi:mCG118776 [Mus musculus]|nr:mCG118776 [Mus musculus]